MLGNNIKSVRESKGLTQKFVAEQIGISQMALYRLEKGEVKVGAEVLHDISKLFGVSMDIFFNNELTESVDLKKRA